MPALCRTGTRNRDFLTQFDRWGLLSPPVMRPCIDVPALLCSKLWPNQVPVSRPQIAALANPALFCKRREADQLVIGDAAFAPCVNRRRRYAQ